MKFQFNKLLFCLTFSHSNFESGYEAENEAGCDGEKGISDHNEFSVQPRNTLRQRNQFEETRLSDDEVATARFTRSGKFINFIISNKINIRRFLVKFDSCYSIKSVEDKLKRLKFISVRNHLRNEKKNCYSQISSKMENSKIEIAKAITITRSLHRINIFLVCLKLQKLYCN